MRYNTRVKIYPNTGKTSTLICSSAIFKEGDDIKLSDDDIKSLSECDVEYIPPPFQTMEEVPTEPETLLAHELETTIAVVGQNFLNNVRRAKSRARQAVYDIAECNNFQYFVTLTLDPDRVKSRYDRDECKRQLDNWLSNQVQRYGAKYVLVPELHKDGALHYHALMSGDFRLKNSGLVTTGKNAGKVIYNMDNWRYGFSTCISVYGEYAQCCNYISKYIVKSHEKIGGRWYLSGGNLTRPCYEYYNTSYADITALLESGEGFQVNGLPLKFWAQ